MAFSSNFRLVPLGMAAVMPTTELSFSHSLTMVWPNTSCQAGGVRAPACGDAPVRMSYGPVPWNFSGCWTATS